MGRSGRTFKVEADVDGRKMVCETESQSIENLVGHITERFGVRFQEIEEIVIKSSIITIKAKTTELQE